MSILTELDIAELETAAADARNAALVVEHAGWAQGFDISGPTGSVCAHGAARLATESRMRTAYKWDSPLFIATPMRPGKSDPGYLNLLVLLATVIPADLCHLCPAFGAASAHRIVHYNDKHCPGGDVLAGLFVLAAERAQTEIANRRSMTSTGRLLATV